MMLRGLLLLFGVSPVLAASPVSGVLSVADNYHYQGISQGQDRVSLSASLEYRVSERVSAGIWVGDFRLPGDMGSTSEVDYYLRLDYPVSFRHRFETSLWRYTFRDDRISYYDWSQWLVSYHLDDRFSLTAGLSDNLLGSDDTSTLLEGTFRYTSGPAVLSLTVGRNDPGGPVMESFAYGRLRLSWSSRDWHLYVDYTDASNVDGPIRYFTKEGLGFGLSYAF